MDKTSDSKSGGSTLLLALSTILCRRHLIIRLIIQTIRQDPSGADQIDDPSNVIRPDRSGADQIDAEHQATDLAVGGSNPSRRAPTPQVNGLGLLALLVMVYAGRDPLTGKKKWVSQVRDANRALYMLAVSRLRWDPRTRAYVAGGPGRARPLLRSSVPQAAPGP